MHRTILNAELLATFILALAASAASAQQVYRIVGPDGRITFSDKPPVETGAKAAPATAGPMRGAAADAGGGALPFDLRQAASRYPVTFYAGPDCVPCDSARSYLGRRGIPYTERTVSTAEDLAALQRLSGAATLPFLTIGGQQLAGFSDVEWSQFLDAAGYPRTSQLPASYRNPAPTPLVTAALPRPAAPTAPAPAAQPMAPAPTPLPPGDNPAGIQF